MMNVFEDANEIGRQIGVFGGADPECLKSRVEECDKGYEKSTLDPTVNQLILVMVCIAINSDRTIFLSHVKLFYELGGKREDLVSALNLAILACGGPGLAWSGIALDQYDQLAAAAE